MKSDFTQKEKNFRQITLPYHYNTVFEHNLAKEWHILGENQDFDQNRKCDRNGKGPHDRQCIFSTLNLQ